MHIIDPSQNVSDMRRLLNMVNQLWYPVHCPDNCSSFCACAYRFEQRMPRVCSCQKV